MTRRQLGRLARLQGLISTLKEQHRRQPRAWHLAHRKELLLLLHQVLPLLKGRASRAVMHV